MRRPQALEKLLTCHGASQRLCHDCRQRHGGHRAHQERAVEQPHRNQREGLQSLLDNHGQAEEPPPTWTITREQSEHEACATIETKRPRRLVHPACPHPQAPRGDLVHQPCGYQSNRITASHRGHRSAKAAGRRSRAAYIDSPNSCGKHGPVTTPRRGAVGAMRRGARRETECPTTRAEHPFPRPLHTQCLLQQGLEDEENTNI